MYLYNMKQSIRKDGYIAVQHNGKQVLLHRLLAEKYIPNPENKPCVNHIDGNRSNNNIDNLEWVTYSENHKHAHRILGRSISGYASKMVNGELAGENAWNNKLIKKDIEEIRNSNLTGVELAMKYNVSRSLISGIKNNKRWK